MARIALSLLLFTSFSFSQDQSTAARTAAGCGPRTAEFSVEADKDQHPVAQPDAGKALVYVFSEPRRDPLVSYLTSATTRVGVDGTWVGANRGKSYIFFQVDPGEHRLCSDMQSSSVKISNIGAATSFSVEAGKSYYFRAKFEERSDRPPYLELERIDSAAGLFLVSSSAYSKYTAKK